MTRSVMTRVCRPTAVLVLSALVGGCAVGPNYKRPAMTVPELHRFVEGSAQAASLADEPFWQVFGDTVLQDLIREAITNNLDLRTAAARVEESRAVAGVAKSFLFPEFNVSGAYTAQQSSRASQPPQDVDGDRNFQNWNAGFTLAWEI